MRRSRGPGMNEVARAAGVSQKTVSRVVNGEPYVSAEVRDRVLRVIRELDYRPNTAARALIRGTYHRIGVVSLGSALSGPASVLMALEQATRRTGYSFALASTLENPGGGYAAAVESLLEQGVDGIILSDPIDDGAPSSLTTDVPVVSLNVVGKEGVAAARAGTEYLLSLGHRTVWHIPGPQNWWSARDRLRGWREALAAAGAPEPPLPDAGDWSPAAGHTAGLRLARTPGVTAVFAANDEMAIGALRAFSEAGLSVPGDISVVGFDDIPAAAYLAPPLTTVRQDFQALADRALGVLLARIEGRARPDGLADLPVHLSVRQSTAPPP
ncbi:LacI family DNA-binding transcriptional regulator [Streptomyces sp. Rer75]|nr:LacI family DNA-binding transcriptional regulator [Streptomyces sp. Rer75]QLH19924.1 LacI family DNA-binding transcriptional regulator [Streptomyces sp. Rer75]